jgi:hypothetical protein
MVDYRATIGRWFWSAYLICGAIDKTDEQMCFMIFDWVKYWVDDKWLMRLFNNLGDNI